jgi:hypothetical protein
MRVRVASTVIAIAAALNACATTEPLPHGNVVTMKANEASSLSGSPPPGTVWRLEEADLKTLSPAPVMEAPPPPRVPPPPRPNAPPTAPYYYPPPPPPGYYGQPY